MVQIDLMQNTAENREEMPHAERINMIFWVGAFVDSDHIWF